MRLTPNDITARRFRRTLTGFAASEVTDFLREVSNDYESVLEESARLREEAASLRRLLDQYRAIDSTIKDALVLAQRTSEETRAAAEREASLVVSQARAEADALQRETARRLEEIHLQRVHFVGQFRALLETQMASLDDHLARNADRPAVGQGTK